MAPALEDLRDALAKTPTDPKALQAFGKACVKASEWKVLRTGVEPLLGDAKDLPGLASTMADILERGAAAEKRPRDAAELYLRAARLWSNVGEERLRAAKALAAAWEQHPSADIGNAALALLGQPELGDAPDYLLSALSQVGPESLRVRALRRLGARHLDERRLDDAESVFKSLAEIHPDDADATLGLSQIKTIRTGAAKDLATAREAAAGAKDDDVAGALTRLGEAEAAAGARAKAEKAYRDAIAAGPAVKAEAGLESLLREDGRLDALQELWESLLTQVPKERQVVLRRRLFRLVHDELGDTVGARRYLVMGHATAPADAEAVIARARAAGEAGDWSLAVQLLEDASSAPNKETKTAILIEQARILEEELSDRAAAERVFRRVRVTDPRSMTALMFYRRWYAENDAPRRAYANLAQLYAVLTGDDLKSERVAVATEMAQVAESGLASYDKAIDAWRRVSQERPGDDTIFVELRRLYTEAGRWHALIDHLEGGIRALAKRSPDKVEPRVDILFEIIGVYQDADKLPMEQMVIKTYQRIVDLSPTNIQALDGLAGGLEEREKWAELVQVLSRRVEVTTEPDELLVLFSDIADLYLERIRSDVQAVGILERILELTPDDLGVIRKLREIYRRRHDSEELYATYQRELALLDGDEQLDTLVELASLATEPLFRPDDAVRWWRAVLAIAPRHEAAQRALQDLHAEQKDWDGYVAVLEEKLQQTKTRKAKVEVLLELGEIVYSRIGDAERAQVIFTQIAELSPFNTTARSFLQRLYVSRRGWPEFRALYAPRDDWRGYIEILQEYGERSDDPPLVADIQREIADVMEAELNDGPGAVRHLELALAAAPERVEVARLLTERYTARTGAPRQVAALMTLAQHSDDSSERWTSWKSVAALETTRKRPSQAFDAWSQATIVGAALGDVDSVEALLESAADTGRWEDAYASLQDALGQADGDDTATRLVLHEQLGEVAANRLMRHAEAADQFKWVLQLDSGHSDALDALEKIYFSQNDFEGLEEVFKARADSATEAEERVIPLRRLGQLYEDILVDGQRAAQTYQEVLAITPEDDEALEALVRVLEVEEAFSDLAQALETALTRIDDLDRRHSVQIRLATLYCEQLDQPEAAVDHLADVIEHQGEDAAKEIETLETLFKDPRSRGAAAPVLETVYRRREEAAPLVKTLEARLATSESVVEKAGMLDEVAMLSESALANPDAAFEAMSRRFALTPAEPDTWSEQLRLAELTDAWETLAEQWRTQIDAGPTDTFEIDALHALRLALADVYSHRIYEVEDAVAQVEIVERESSDEAVVFAALELLELLYKRAADLDGYVRVKLLAADRVSNRPARRQKILEAATVLAGPLKRSDEAVKHVRALLDEDPSSFDVAEMLASLYETKGDLKTLDALYETWIGLTESPELLDELHFRRATLRRDRLDAWELAIDEFVGLIGSQVRGYDARQALLEISRAQESANQRGFILEALSEYYGDAKNSEGQLAVLLVRADFATPGEPRAAVLRQAATLCLPVLDASPLDTDAAQNAFDLYTQALYESPSDTDALAALMTISERLDTWEGLAEALSACAEQAEPTAAVDLWQREADVAENHLDDIPRAIAAWRQHLALADGGAKVSLDAALSALSRLLDKTGDVDARLDILARQREATDDPATIMSLASEQVPLLQQQDRLADAIDVMHDAYNKARGSAGLREEASTHLETLLTSSGRHADVVTLILNHAEGVEDQETGRMMRYRAAELAEERAEDRLSAIAIHQDILTDFSADETALSELGRLYGATDDWAARANTLERRLALSASSSRGEDPETQAYRLSLGALYADRLDRVDHAIHMFHAVLEVEPTDETALKALDGFDSDPEHGPAVRMILADVFRDSADDEALAVVLTKIISSGDAFHDLGGVHQELALLNRDSFEDPDRAWQHGAAAYRLAATGTMGESRRRIVLDMAKRYNRISDLATLLLSVGDAIDAPAVRLKRRLEDLEAMQSAGAQEAALLPFWQAVLKDDPRNADGLDEVETWARVHEDRDLLIDVLRTRLSGPDAPKAQVPVQLDLAEILAQENRGMPEAASLLAAALESEPAHVAAFELLTETYETLKQPADLANIIVARRAVVEGAPPHALTR
ncbi:MAG: lipopolysaccharide biosynthesis regulator YciM, partial [Myxococcota bacterium]